MRPALLFILSALCSACLGAQELNLISEWNFQNPLYVNDSGNKLYCVSSGNLGGLDAITEINMEDPVNPEAYSWFETDLNPLIMEVFNDMAFVTNSGNPTQLEMVDFSDPANPVQLGSYTGDTGLPGISYPRFYYQDHFYLVSSSSVLSVLDVGDPQNITLVNTMSIDNDLGTPGAVIHDDILYLGTNQGLQLFTCADPQNLTPIITIEGNYSNISADFEADRLLLTTLSPAGMTLMSIENPVVPVVLDQVNSGNTWAPPVLVNGTAIEGTPSDILIYDVSGDEFVLLDTETPPTDIIGGPAATETHVIVQSFLDETVFVYGYTNPASVQEVNTSLGISCFPNPSTGVVQIQSDQSLDGRYVVHDALGREIQTGNLFGMQAQIDLSSHPAGCYQITVEFAEGFGQVRLVLE